MQTSAAGRHFIEVQEGCRLRAYRDAAGVLTIGYGHTTAAGNPLVLPGMSITQAQADAILTADLHRVESQVTKTVSYPLNQAQFDALVSFTYNLGIGNLQHLVVASGLDEDNIDAVPEHMLLYDHAGGVALAGLQRRRKLEAAMFQGHYPAV